LAVAASIGVGSTLQAVLGAFLLKRCIGLARLFERGRAILTFALIEAFSCLLAASWGVATLWLAGLLPWTTGIDSWRTWWLGDLNGVLILTPLLLPWARFCAIKRRPGRVAEAIQS